MIVCHCAGVSDTTITRHINEGAVSVDDIMTRTGAGRRCSPCREEIANLLLDHLPMFRPADPSNKPAELATL
jgi:bacterioferritin-associated ferredoxin